MGAGVQRWWRDPFRYRNECADFMSAIGGNKYFGFDALRGTSIIDDIYRGQDREIARGAAEVYFDLAPGERFCLGPPQSITQRPRNVAYRPERVMVDAPKSSAPCSQTMVDTDGTVVPCLFSGEHATHRFIRFREPVNRCGLCGQEFQIDKADPHWSTGRWRCPTERT